jgi:hypothetical protein
LVPLADRARNALAAARDLDPEGADTARLAGALADVERALVHDPLALADFSVEEVLARSPTRSGPVTAPVRGARRRSERVDGRDRRTGDGARRGRGPARRSRARRTAGSGAGRGCRPAGA